MPQELRVGRQTRVRTLSRPRAPCRSRCWPGAERSRRGRRRSRCRRRWFRNRWRSSGSVTPSWRRRRRPEAAPRVVVLVGPGAAGSVFATADLVAAAAVSLPPSAVSQSLEVVGLRDPVQRSRCHRRRSHNRWRSSGSVTPSRRWRRRLESLFSSAPSPPGVSSRPPTSSRPPSVSLPPLMVSQSLEVVGPRDPVSTLEAAPRVVVLVGAVAAGSVFATADLVAAAVGLVAAVGGLTIVGGRRAP